MPLQSAAGFGRDWKAEYFAGKRAKEVRGRQQAIFGQMLGQSGEADAAQQLRFDQMQTRSQEGAAGQQTRYDAMLGRARDVTGQRQADIRSDAASQQAASAQRLSRLGMGNTTVGGTMGKGITRDMNAELNRTSDAFLGRELGIMGAGAQQAAAGTAQGLGIMGQAAGAAERGTTRQMALLGQQVGTQDPGEAERVARIQAAPALLKERRAPRYKLGFGGPVGAAAF